MSSFKRRGELSSTREGGFMVIARILHAADATGKEVETILVSRAQNHPNIQVLERSNAVDLTIPIKWAPVASPPGRRWRLDLESQ